MLTQVKLGATAVEVSRLGFGTLSLSPLQTSLSPEAGAELLCHACSRGVGFWDTAQIYRNYNVLAMALRKLAKPPVIATKTYAWNARQAQEAVDEARSALGLDVLDIVLLHEQTALTLPGHREALDWLTRARDKGIIKAVGVSTHSVQCVHALGEYPQIEILHPLYNLRGVGILDGDAPAMAAALATASDRGLGIYAMKVLGGGSLFREARAAIGHALTRPWLDSIVLGMISSAEIEYNVALCSGSEPGPELESGIICRLRHLHVASWCHGCGVCTGGCPQGALTIFEGRVKVNAVKCLSCGYCVRLCNDMCLKLI